MLKTKFGKTNREVSKLGFGCGGYWGLKIFPETEAENLIRVAIENGINFFDTGANYSGGNAEHRLGRILSTVDTSKLLIGTKAGTKLVGKKIVKDFSRKNIIESAEASLKKLRLNHLPLFQLHFPGVNDINEESLGALNSLKERGLVELTGVSCDGAAAYKAVSVKFFDSIMTSFNIIDCDFQKIDSASKSGLAVLAMSPLARTVYSSDLWKVSSLNKLWYLLRAIKNYRSDLIKGLRFRFINEVEGWTGADIALNYVIQNRFITCAVIGTTNEKHLLDNISSSQKVAIGEDTLMKIFQAQNLGRLRSIESHPYSA